MLYLNFIKHPIDDTRIDFVRLKYRMALRVHLFSPMKAIFCCFHSFCFSIMKYFPDTILSKSSQHKYHFPNLFAAMSTQ